MQAFFLFMGSGDQTFFIATFLLLGSFFLTQHLVLSAIRRVNRRMAPGFVWLQYLPLIGNFWQFMVVIEISRSAVRQRFTFVDESLLGVADHGVRIGSHPTLAMGLASAILSNLTVILLFTDVPDSFRIVPAALATASVVTWVVYWIQLLLLRRKLIRLQR